MSSTEATVVINKLQALSKERASRVLSLIEDLAELEALEDAEDLKDAREALAEMRGEAVKAQVLSPGKAQFANGETTSRAAIPYEQIRHELGLDR